MPFLRFEFQHFENLVKKTEYHQRSEINLYFFYFLAKYCELSFYTILKIYIFLNLKNLLIFKIKFFIFFSESKGSKFDHKLNFFFKYQNLEL